MSEPGFNLPDFKERQKREAGGVQFVSAKDAFKAQVEVTMTRDVSGWVDHGMRLRYSLAKGQSYMVDEQLAVEFIVKNYATGKLPRDVSDDEAAEIRLQEYRVTPDG